MKIAFTAAMLLLYRLGAYIPAPGIDTAAVKDLESNFSGNGILPFLNLFSGGSLSRLSLFALGIMPYITASIILQLMTVVVPSLEQLQKEGEAGYAKINSEIPLPIPRCVISSPIHIRIVQPAVSVTTIRNTFGKVRSPITLLPEELNRKTNPRD